MKSCSWRAPPAHGIYVGNAVLAREGEVVALFGRDHLLGCLWFGPRGNLIVLESEPLDPELVAIAVHESRWPWRIALGPDPTVALLSQRVVGKVLVNRAQVYHGCQPVAVVHQKPPWSCARRSMKTANGSLRRRWNSIVSISKWILIVSIVDGCATWWIAESAMAQRW